MLFVVCGLFASASGEDKVVFTGSLWDAADSFRLTFDLEPKRTRIHWEGGVEAYFESKAEKPEHFTLTTETSPDEDRALRKLFQNFQLCHSGPRLALGTGLSVTVERIENGKQRYRYFYFGMDKWTRLGTRAERFPVKFQRLVGDKEFSAVDRAKFFEEVSSFADDVESYSKAVSILEKCRIESREVPWERIHQLVVRSYSDDYPEYEAAMGSAINEVPLVLDTMISERDFAAYFDDSDPSRIAVAIDDVSISSVEYYLSRIPILIASDNNRWGFFPPSLRNLLEDYVGEPEFKPLNGLYHPVFEIVVRKNTEAERMAESRLAFIDNSDWKSSLFENEVESDSVGHLRIHSMSFEENLTKCAIHCWGVPEESAVTLLTVEDAEWKILRRIDWKDWQEYGWKEPVFKRPE